LTKGNPEFTASLAAKAVLPALGAPSKRMLTSPGPSVLAAYSTNLTIVRKKYNEKMASSP